VDVGTGDGRLPLAWARETPRRLFIGVDANAAGLRDLSGRAAREGRRNVAYVRAAAEALPPELEGIADRLTVVLPWGSLLAAVALPSVQVLRGLRRICQPGALVTVVLGSDPSRDQAELRRLGLPPLEVDDLAARITPGYEEAGLRIERVRAMSAEEVAGFPTTWVRRLAFGGTRSFVQLSVRATLTEAGRSS
jgi:16S rRNA (adenine(1408)-N(1))-methyltransferase